jgi:hypothetical protein
MDPLVTKLWTDVAACKAAETCSRLPVRTYFFEPNPGTVAAWQSETRFSPSVDRRVVFVCESPTKHAKGDPDFIVPGTGVSGWRCWGGYNASVTDGFWKAREAYGLGNCWITNVVKCGAGPGMGKPNIAEIERCSTFLRRELEVIQPAVIALVGRTDTPKFFRRSIPSLSFLDSSPKVVNITHYSYERRPGGRGRMQDVWAPEFKVILDELARRGWKEPVWL